VQCVSPFRNRQQSLRNKIRQHQASAPGTVIAASSGCFNDAWSGIVQAKGKRTEPDSGEGHSAAKKLRADEGAAVVTAESHSGAQPEAEQSPASVRLTVCRDGAVLLARVALATEDGLGTDCLVHFCGAQVQVTAFCTAIRHFLIAKMHSELSPCKTMVPSLVPLDFYRCMPC